MHRGVSTYAAAQPYRGSDPDSALIEKHSDLITKQVRMLVGRTGADQHASDLWTAGALGLVDAARRYEAGQEASFESFASHRVRGAMLDELRKLDHLPRRLRTRTEQVRKRRVTLSQELGREPDRTELAEDLEIDLEELSVLEGLMQPTADVEDHLGALIDLPTIVDDLGRASLLEELTSAVEMLPDRLQMVLALRYTEGLTLREIAGLLEVSEPRVSQLHSEAIRRLRMILHDDGSAPSP